MVNFLIFLNFLVMIWFILALIKPNKFIPFLKKPNRLKAIGLWFLVSIILSALMAIVAPKSEDTVKNNQQIAVEKEIAKNIFINMDVVDTLEQAQAVEGALQSVGVTGVKSIEYDELLSDDSNGIRCFRLNTNVHPNIILYMNPNKTVYEIKMAGTPLMQNGNIVATLQDFTVSVEEKIKFINATENGIKAILKAPSTAKFPGNDAYLVSKDHGIVTVEGYVDSQNSFGAMLRAPFKAQFDTKNDNKVKYLEFEGKALINN